MVEQIIIVIWLAGWLYRRGGGGQAGLGVHTTGLALVGGQATGQATGHRNHIICVYFVFLFLFETTICILIFSI